MAATSTTGNGGVFLFAADTQDVTTPEDYSPDARTFGATLREYIEREVVPNWDAIDDSAGEPVPELMRGLGEIGFFMAEVPEEFGGMGLGLTDIMPMMEELGRCGGVGVAAMVHQGIGMQPLLFAGSDELLRRYIEPLMSAELLSAYALTEPGHGSDALSGKTTAVLNEAGTEWTLNGAKQFITNAKWAGIFQVFAQVEGKGFSAFLVEGGTPGLEVTAEEHKLGIKSSSTCGLRLKDVKVPRSQELGELGRGHKLALNMLNLGRLKLGTTMIGAMKAILGHVVRYGNERVQFGQPIIAFGMLRSKLAEIGALIFASEAVAARTAGAIDRMTAGFRADGIGREAKLLGADEYACECSIVKVYLTEAAGVCADHGVQMYGGYGFTEEYPVARFYRDVRVSRLYEGTNEINRLNTVNALLRRMYRGAELDRWTDLAEKGTSATGDPAAPLRRVFSRLFRHIIASANGQMPRLEQDVIAALADVAKELFAAESAHLRAARIEAGTAPPDLKDLSSRFAALTLARAGRLTRDRAGAAADALGILDAALRKDLDECARIADNAFAQERAAAELLLRFNGEWPM